MATEAIHAGEIHDQSRSHIAPIYSTSTFTFEDMAAVEAWGEGEADAYIYSRGGNPGRAALAAYEKILKSHPQDTQALRGMALALEQAGR